MKYWIVTGISSGLGKSLAELLIAKGEFVIGTFRNENQVNEFNSRKIENAKAFQLDLDYPNSVRSFSQSILTEFERVDVLVNNAGRGYIGAIEEASNDDLRSIFETHFFGPMQLTKSLLPLLRKQKFGHIVQISSHSGFKAVAGFGNYSASKFAFEGASEALADELSPLGIKVTIIEPGPFRTEFASASLRFAKDEIADYAETAGNFRNRIKQIHGKQEGDPEKAAEIIFSLSGMDKIPLRLALGKIAIATIRSKIDKTLSDLTENRILSESAVF